MSTHDAPIDLGPDETLERMAINTLRACGSFGALFLRRYLSSDSAGERFYLLKLECHGHRRYSADAREYPDLDSLRAPIDWGTDPPDRVHVVAAVAGCDSLDTAYEIGSQVLDAAVSDGLPDFIASLREQGYSVSQ
jgi:hypothetical protein